MRSMTQLVSGGALLAAALLLAAGCSPKSPATVGTGKEKRGGHDHPDEGPHGGALAEWGQEEYHAEFTVDHGKKQATVYILDDKARKAAPVQAETISLVITNVQPPANITLRAEPQEGDPKGTSSRFVGQHDALAKEMEFKGEISGKVGDKPFTGEFEEKAHKGHKHDKK